jgi:hypothetical protein
MMFGVCRLATLRETALIGAYPASDTVLLAALALRGVLLEIDEPLFFWRDHADRPTRVCTSDAELAERYAPENAGRMQFRHLALLAGYLQAIRGARLPPRQRLRCLGIVAQWFLVKLPVIQDEVRGNIAAPVRRALGRSLPATERTDSAPRAT